MTAGASAARGRRWFMRSATGAALAMVAAGAQAVLGSATALAQNDGCCSLLSTQTTWCHWLCTEQNQAVRCWTCNSGSCKCCECSVGTSCFSGITFCSYKIGCC